MSTATLTATTNGYHPPPAIPAGPALDAATLERVMLDGDLKGLSPAQRIQWYRARCEAAGLDPRAQPFQYLTLQNKLILYATKAATDQLTGIHRLSVEVVRREMAGDLCIVDARATFPDGRRVDDTGAVSTQGLKGEALCNAILKATTKAKRRTVLSACGLGMLDESEVDSIPGASRLADDREPPAPKLDNGSGFGQGSYASPTDVDKFERWAKDSLAEANARYLDRVAARRGGDITGVQDEACNWHQLMGHLLNFAVRAELIENPGTIVNKVGKEVLNVRLGQRPKYVALAYIREPEALKEEARDYFEKCEAEALDKIAPVDPEDAEIARQAERDGGGR